jgi:peptidoglycan/LPS O-acetylase OafA/YrhL
MTRRLSELSGRHDNNFTLIRLLAALMVMYSHSYPLALGWGTPEPLTALTHGRHKLGEVAVDVFFAISGFLVTASLLQRRDLLGFYWARLLRIFPALWVSLCVCAYGIGWLFTTLPARAYLGDPEIRHFITGNASLRELVYFLPGVFAANPYPSAVVGSIWTLPYEVAMYLYLGGFWLLARRFFEHGVAVIAGFALVAYVHLLMEGPPESPTASIHLEYARFTSLFALGALHHLLREHVPLHPALFAAAVALMVPMALELPVPDACLKALYLLALPYAVLFLASADWPPARQFNRVGDYSYGLYIYAFPIQQSVMALGLAASPPALFAWAFVLTLPVAALSWHGLERPALELKSAYRLLGRALAALPGRCRKALRQWARRSGGA